MKNQTKSNWQKQLLFINVTIIFLIASGCGGLSSNTPKAVIEKFVADAESGNVEAMNKAFSKRALQQDGEKIRSNNKSYSDLIKSMGTKEKPTIFALKEKDVNGKTIVSYNYGINKNGVGNGANTGCTAFELINEDGGWKIDNSAICQ